LPQFIKFSEAAEHKHREGMEKLRKEEYFTDPSCQANAVFCQNLQRKHSSQTRKKCQKRVDPDQIRVIESQFNCVW